MTITNYLGQQLSTLPRIGSKGAYLLQFILIALVFCFYAIVEYVCVHYLTRVENRLSIIYELAKKAKQEKITKEIERRKNIKRCRNREGVENGEDTLRIMNTVVDLENVAPRRDDMVKFGLYKIDRLFLKPDGTMRFKDQHVDIVSRYVYPIIFLFMYAVFHFRWTHKANK